MKKLLFVPFISCSNGDNDEENNQQILNSDGDPVIEITGISSSFKSGIYNSYQ